MELLLTVHRVEWFGWAGAHNIHTKKVTFSMVEDKKESHSIKAGALLKLCKPTYMI